MKIIIILIIFIEITLKPRFDITKEKNVLLWLGRNKRFYFILFKIQW